ncbi:hypothetical protein M404DRAFT_996512 [Pisolithus tinctorius Marx 270]|uniref:Uncharacterized protein n=1 Tax=Pisolithus tinctorius Marx 270 TaxID=870435 RepID=A0A0C3P873_PISTI|nr:hypothetical protein M404DRAFT_996512 [Pisolithus tinctorius Marx 270]
MTAVRGHPLYGYVIILQIGARTSMICVPFLVSARSVQTCATLTDPNQFLTGPQLTRPASSKVQPKIHLGRHVENGRTPAWIPLCLAGS